DDFGKLAAGKPAAELRVERRRAGRGDVGDRIPRSRTLRRGQRPIKASEAQQRFEVGAGESHELRVFDACSFAFCDSLFIRYANYSTTPARPAVRYLPSQT